MNDAAGTSERAAVEAVGALLSPLLGALERLLWVQRNLHPPFAARLADQLAPVTEALSPPLHALEALAWPDGLRFVCERLVEVTRQTLEITTAFVEATRSSGEVFELYRALRRVSRVQEALYPLAPMFEAVSRWFLDPPRRDDAALVERLRAAALRDDDTRTGVLHAENERNARGGFSLYVPETYDEQTPLPLVVALHGGHGHGRDFLWSWVREARARAIVIAPTARSRTWSIMGGPDVDAEPLRQMVDFVGGRYAMDATRVLLTGMSDGGTYALLCGLADGMPYTHLAPACGALHPFLLANGGISRARGRPVYLIHGALDWMFPVPTARMSRDVLTAAGAHVVYREIADLSHTYPREENTRILDWLEAEPAAPPSA